MMELTWLRRSMCWLFGGTVKPVETVNVHDHERKGLIRQADVAKVADAQSKAGRVSREPQIMGGRLVAFEKLDQHTCGRQDYVVIARRGGWSLGMLRFRNQWNEYAFYSGYSGAEDPVIISQAMVAEIYAMLKELKQRG